VWRDVNLTQCSSTITDAAGLRSPACLYLWKTHFNESTVCLSVFQLIEGSKLAATYHAAQRTCPSAGLLLQGGLGLEETLVGDTDKHLLDTLTNTATGFTDTH